MDESLNDQPLTPKEWTVNTQRPVIESLAPRACSPLLQLLLDLVFINSPFVCCSVTSHVQLFVIPMEGGAWRATDFPGKNTGVGCHFLLQGIFPTQGLNPSLLHWQMDYH